MLFVSNYLLNNTTQIKQMPIWPYIHSLSNVQTSEDVLRRVAVPDVLPGDLPAAGGSMSMTAGDFVEVYSRPEEKGRWDAILTCFFMVRARLSFLAREWFLVFVANGLATATLPFEPKGHCQQCHRVPQHPQTCSQA